MSHPGSSRSGTLDIKNTMDEDGFDFEDGVCGRNARMAIERRAAILQSRPFFGSAPEAPQPIPDDLLRILACSEQPAEAITKLFPVATESLTPENYKEKQHLLLFIEEFERSSWRGIIMHRWKPTSQRRTQDSVDVEPKKQPAVFVVRRPSGEEVPGRSTIARSNQPCKCFCQSVCLNGKIVATTEVEIVITLDADMEHTEVLEDVVLYFLKRSPFFRNLHQAVDRFPARLGTAGFPDLKSTSKFPQVYASFIDQPEVNLGAEKELWREAVVLLNRGASGGKLTKEDRAALPKPRIRFYNCALDYRQRCAVEEVVIGAHRPGPYIIFGPPGTGKTMTLVEIVIQLVLKCPTSRIVVSAPTDSAVDVLLRFLIASKQADVVWRAGGWVKLVDGSERSSSSNLSLFTRAVSAPDIFERIVFMTCKTAGRIPEYHKLVFDMFTHVVVDEAGSAIEPEIMLPILLLHIRGDMQIVMAGDVYQMRPYVTSQLASQFGLEISLLSRLLSRPPSQRSTANLEVDDYFDRRNITSLVHQYRSSPTILEVSNRIFYDNKLIFRPEDQSNSSNLPPIVFCSVDGHDGMDCSGSKFNLGEADVVKQYVRKLFSLGVPLTDIAVISAYQAQVRQIVRLLSISKLPEDSLPPVRTIDEFVGCESRVVLITAVESHPSCPKSRNADSREGFVESPDRLNVALSRALDHVCIVGNAAYLSQDLFFAELIKHCGSMGTLVDRSQLLSF